MEKTRRDCIVASTNSDHVICTAHRHVLGHPCALRLLRPISALLRLLKGPLPPLLLGISPLSLCLAFC